MKVVAPRTRHLLTAAHSHTCSNTAEKCLAFLRHNEQETRRERENSASKRMPYSGYFFCPVEQSLRPTDPRTTQKTGFYSGMCTLNRLKEYSPP